jgi:hypothetical protein
VAAAAVTGISVSAWLTLVGVIEVQREAIQGGFLVDLQGNPTAAIVPRIPWELQALQVMIAAVAVWLLGRYLLRQPSAIRQTALIATAGVVVGVMLTAGAVGYGLDLEASQVGYVEEWVYGGFTSPLGAGVLGSVFVAAAASRRQAGTARRSAADVPASSD